MNDVLDQLLIDARQSMQKIARKCATYRQKIWREMTKMEQDHTIWGYTAVVDEEKLGWKLFMVLLKTRPLSRELVEAQIKRVREDVPGQLAVRLLDIYYLNGSYDWVVIFAARKWNTAKKYYDNLRKVYEQHLTEKPEMADIMFSTLRWGKVNPEIERLHDFVPP
ncbi:MAG: Lrp/AsnC family transcriptional regulator [Candidatus Thermoplasmatota archaeon]|nr:Lrp/AsnC family transcriptional regulator [Candidatus Thermoplasmatota archaeon]